MVSQSQEWYLRVEAVNLDHSVFDTYDISTIRGGSFLLLDAVKTLHEKIPELHPEVTGASVGLFRFTSCDQKDENAILGEVEKALKEQMKTKHFATFICTIRPVSAEEPINESIERLIAECRWQQYRTLSFVLPNASNAMNECPMNGVRPADAKIERSKVNVDVSIAVKERFDNGRKLRNGLYESLLGKTVTVKAKFTSDLETLAGKTEDGATEDKIALIHLDGNTFGTIKAENCKTLHDFKDFNKVIQKSIQEPALERLLLFATNPENTGFRTKDKDKKVRIETLMWGGDEIEWIVPASQLWDTLQIFFEVASSPQFKEKALTYSAGVVVCRHTVPILQIRRYAEQLCGIAKDASKAAPSNQFALLNMSSFDAIHRDVGNFLDTYYHPAKKNDFVVPFSDMEALRQHVRLIKKYFPKNKLYEIVAALQDPLQAKKKADEIIDRALKMISKPWKEPTKKAIEAITASNDNKWFFISDIWSLVDDTVHEPTI